MRRNYKFSALVKKMGDPTSTTEEVAGFNGDAGCSGPSSIMGVGPPSPLTGCYLMIIIGEPHSDEHKDIILQRLLKGKTTLLQRIYIFLPLKMYMVFSILYSPRRKSNR